MATIPRLTGPVIAALALVSGCAPARAHPAVPSPSGGPGLVAADTTRVTVTGTASVQVPADRARVAVAVETAGATAADASSANAEAMDRVLAAVRGPAGDGARIETSGYTLMPQYRTGPDREGPPEIVGYRAANQVTVVVADVDRVGPVLDAALAAGANRISGLSFFASDTEEARLAAIREATARARAEADAVADALGLSVLSAESVQTSGGGRFLPQAESAVMLRGASTPVEPGSQTVDVTVTITWILGGAR